MAQRVCHKVIDAGTMTGTDVVTSKPTSVAGMQAISYQAIWTGTPNGAFTFQGSNNYDSVRDTGDWEDLTLDNPPTDPAGSADSWLMSIVGYAYGWIRVQYTNASSTGVLNVWGFFKE